METLGIPIKGVKYRSFDKKLHVPNVPQREPGKRGMTEARRKYLESLRQREEDRCKKEKISKILLRKLVIKFGSNNRKIIGKLVGEYLVNNANITPNSLIKLETDILEAIRNASTTATAPQPIQQAPETNDSKSSSSKPKLPPPGTEWEVINIYQSIIQDERARREAEESLQKKKKFKESLDMQIREARLIKEQLDKTDRRYHDAAMDDLRNYEANQKAVQALERQKHAEEQQIRRKQIEDHLKQMAIDKAAAQKIEEETVRFAQEKAARDKQLQAQRRAEEARIQKQITLSNELNKEKHREQKLKEKEEDNKLMREYEAKLDREAFERDNAFKKRLEKIDAKGSLFAENAGKAAREEELRLELFLLNEAKKKEEADLAALAKKEEDRRKREEKARIENERMLAWRLRMEELERKEEEVLAAKFKEELDNYRSDELERWRSNKEKQMKYRLALRAQELAKQNEIACQGTTPMHTREREINMEVLTKAVEDVPDIVDKARHRRQHTGNDLQRSGGNLW